MMKTTSSAEAIGENSPHKVVAKRIGRIQYEGVLVPAAAPIDLICEECEKSNATKYCSACEEVFCDRCLDLAHPLVSQNDKVHKHMKDGKIRGLQYGDKSKVKKEVESFHLPDEELQMEDYMKFKDLSKPNSLSTGTEAKILKPSKERRGRPQFKVNQLVLFKDPVSKRDAYGQVLSEWDQIHGTGATPAILRGENSLLYYIVQQHGLLVDVEHLVDLVPGLQEKLNNNVSSATKVNSTSSESSTYSPNAEHKNIENDADDSTVISDSTHSTMLVKGTDKDIPLRKEYLIARSVNKRLKDLQNILLLGPKYHLRDLRDPKNIIAKQNHPEAFFDDNRTHYTVDQSMATSTYFGPTTTIMSHNSMMPNMMNNEEVGEPRGGDTSAANQSIFRREITSPGKVSIAGDRSVLTFKPRLPVLQQYHTDSLQQEAAEKREKKDALEAAPYENIDLNLYANIDGDAQTLLSYYNPHYKPLPAPQRSYEDLIRSQELFPIDKSLQKSLTEEGEHHHAVFYHTDRYSNGRREAPAWSHFLVFGENELQSLHSYIEDIERRKRQLLTRIFNRQDYLWVKLQLHRKFRYWKNNLKAIWIQRQHICATKIQSQARVWLCRDKISELREYWAQIYEERRLAVHSQFRFSHRGDKYAVTYDNKKFFATHADMNRYCRFLALMLSKIARFMNRKRLRLVQKTIVVWKSAIYDFIESTLQNEHIDMKLVEFDRQQQNGEFSIDKEKEKMIETFHSLMNSLPDHVHLENKESANKDYSKWYDNRLHGTVSSWPLRIDPPLSFFDTHKATKAEANALQAQFLESVPPYDPATMMPFLPELPRIQRPQTFKERLQQDLAAAAANQVKDFDVHSASAALEMRVPMAGAVSHSYWMLPQVVLVGDAPFGPAHITSWKLVPTYDVFDEKRIYHHEPFPIELQYPYESGCNGFLNDEDVDIVGGITMIRRNKQRAIQRQQEAKAKSSNLLSKSPRKKEVLSMITQLLMAGVDTFVSLLSEREEKLVEDYYKSPPIVKLIDEAMEKAQLTANRIIIDNQDTIRKQEAHLDKIPNYGKTDPRYPQAFREKLRCQARIALAESNISRIRLQVKNIPKNGIKFHRLPVMEHAYPWTADHVLPSLWKLEKIIAVTMKTLDPVTKVHGRIYFYGGGLSCIEDGPARDGRAGLFMAMVLGRLYHIEPQETLYRWQKAHDCMPALKYMKFTATSSSTSYLTNCPPLPWQKNLLFDILQRSHLPLDYPTIRTQLEPDRFQDLYRNHYDESLRYQVQMVQAALELQEDNQNQTQSKPAVASTPSAPFKVPGIKIRSNAGVVAKPAVEENQNEADKGYSVAYVEAERQEAILRSGKERLKQSEYFHQELIWPPRKDGEILPYQSGMGTNYSRKHRSAIVMTSSGKSTRESKREAESRKLERRATKMEARSSKLMQLKNDQMVNEQDDEDEESNEADQDGSDGSSSHFSESSSGSLIHFQSIDNQHDNNYYGHVNHAAEEGEEDEGEDEPAGLDATRGKLYYSSQDATHRLHSLSPMKEIINEDDA